MIAPPGDSLQHPPLTEPVDPGLSPLGVDRSKISILVLMTNCYPLGPHGLREYMEAF